MNRMLRSVGVVLALALSSSAFAAGMPAGAEDAFNHSSSIAFKYSLGTLIKQALGSASGVALADGQINVGNGSGVATPVTLSGDVTMTDTGVTTIAASAVTSAKLDQTVMRYTSSVTLTQTLLQAIHTTPVSLIAAPGSGKLIVVDEVEILHTYSTAQYATCGKLQVQYHGSSDIVDAAATTITAAASHTFILRPNAYDVDNSTGSTPVNLDAQANLGVDVTAATADCTAGNAANVLKLRVKYRVITLLT